MQATRRRGARVRSTRALVAAATRPGGLAEGAQTVTEEDRADSEPEHDEYGLDRDAERIWKCLPHARSLASSTQLRFTPACRDGVVLPQPVRAAPVFGNARERADGVAPTLARGGD
jgi:hypothetical protein